MLALPLSRRGKITLAILGAVLVIGGLTVLMATGSSDELSDQDQDHDHNHGTKLVTESSQLDTDLQNGIFESDEHEHMDREGEDESFEVSGQKIPSATIANTAVPIAEAAALAYVTQSTSETYEQRQTRLQTVFLPTSQAVYNKPPAVDSTNTPNTTTTPSLLYSRWTTNEIYILVTVAMKVSTHAADGSLVSEVYQGWEVGIIPGGDTFQAYTIELSDIPIVVGGNS